MDLRFYKMKVFIPGSANANIDGCQGIIRSRITTNHCCNLSKCKYLIEYITVRTIFL